MVDNNWKFIYWDDVDDSDYDDEWVDEKPKWKSDRGKTVED